jgi:hypothetical protein
LHKRKVYLIEVYKCRILGITSNINPYRHFHPLYQIPIPHKNRPRLINQILQKRNMKNQNSKNPLQFLHLGPRIQKKKKKKKTKIYHPKK